MTATPTTLTHGSALGMLLSRRSTHLLQEPAPDGAELERILEAGLRAPDHGRLRPWRFVLIRGPARAALGEVYAAALLRRDPVAEPVLIERQRQRAQRAPLTIALGAHVRPEHPVPELEQLLSVGAAAMNMLNAAHMLGYAGMWVSGPVAYDPTVAAALGLAVPDRLVGFLHLGTARVPPPAVAPPERGLHVVEWSGIPVPPISLP